MDHATHLAMTNLNELCYVDSSCRLYSIQQDRNDWNLSLVSDRVSSWATATSTILYQRDGITCHHSTTSCHVTAIQSRDNVPRAKPHGMSIAFDGQHFHAYFVGEDGWLYEVYHHVQSDEWRCFNISPSASTRSSVEFGCPSTDDAPNGSTSRFYISTTDGRILRFVMSSKWDSSEISASARSLNTQHSNDVILPSMRGDLNQVKAALSQREW